MHFTSLSLRNWRQFYGQQQPIEFSTSRDAPVTLIFGPNGAGKTGLLNAFTWCLYEDFTAGFDEPDKLIHDLALKDGGDPYVEVALSFDDDGDLFTVVRRRRPGDTASQVSVKRKPGLGKKRAGETLDATITDVYNVLPRSLKDVFFFPAESLQTLSITDGTAGGGIDLRKAIESLLGFDTYTRASHNLRTALQADSLRTPHHYRDNTIEAARVKWEEAQAAVARFKQRRTLLPDEITAAALALEEARVEESRNNKEAIDAWSKQRDGLRDDREAAKQAVDDAMSVLAECFRQLESGMYASPLIDDALRSLDAAERQGKIPPSVSSDLLDKLIAEPELPCVLCGRQMDEGAHEHVRYLREAVADSNVAANAPRHA